MGRLPLHKMDSGPNRCFCYGGNDQNVLDETMTPTRRAAEEIATKITADFFRRHVPYLQDLIEQALERARNEALEEAAMMFEQTAWIDFSWAQADKVAQNIRSLKTPGEGK